MSRRRPNAFSATSLSPKRSRRNETSESRARRNSLLGNDISGRIRVISDQAFGTTSNILKEIYENKGLQPTNLQMYPHENKHAHHTENYETDNLVLRRGQDFDMALTFDRPYEKERDKLVLQFSTGARPKESKGSIVRIDVVEKYEPVKDIWQARIVATEKNILELRVISSPEAIIGRYKIFVETVTVDDVNNYQERKEFTEGFVLIFNPFCTGDMVYMEDDVKRTEYVMNETGRLWLGSSRGTGTPWYFGQFETVALEAALYLLEKSELMEGAKSNCISVIRVISQMSNSNDDDGGILEGRWSEDYPKGTLPWAWVGSIAILNEFIRTKKTVKYGQCWVFSGLVTTLCRSLGIPTRSVTNFDSAHDTDGSATIDYHWNENDEPLDDLNDSVWNFHVWNESWFRRPDLPEGYDGWQVFDATPQELSEGVMKCGPSPVKAIKDGLVYLPYDTKFIFSEVNGDKVHWLMKKDGTSEVLRILKDKIGRHISTKAVDSDSRHDITFEYKYPEGSQDERNSVHRAFRHSSRKEYKVYHVDEPDVKFDLHSPEEVVIGEDFELKVKLKNLTEEERNVHIRLSAVGSFYTGVPSETVCVEVFEEKLQTYEEKTITLPITCDTYINILKPDSTMTVYLKGTVKETGRSYPDIERIEVTKPNLMISVPEKVKIKEDFEVVIHLTNPLQEKVTGGIFYIESSRGIILPFTVPYRKIILPGEAITVRLNAKATRSGNRDILVNFTADQLTGMKGSSNLYVSYAE